MKQSLKRWVTFRPVTYKPHKDLIQWKHFPRYWPFLRGIHQSTVNFPHKGKWRRTLMFSLICAWINGWVNNHEAGDLRFHRAHYDITVMYLGNYLCDQQAMAWMHCVTKACRWQAKMSHNTSNLIPKYCKISNIRRTKSPNFQLILQLSLLNPLKPGAKPIMKM